MDEAIFTVVDRHGGAAPATPTPADGRKAVPPAHRVLCVGQVPEVVETIVGELSALGVRASGATGGAGAAAGFDAQAFDLIALDGDLRGDVGASLKRSILLQNPHVHILETYAPRAVREIMAALAGRTLAPTVDLDAYFARIGYHGLRTPTLATLRALQELHPAAITFEAIDILLGRGIDISPAAIDAKLIHGRRGGYCYEQNGLFKRVLTALGFEVDGLLARVRWMEQPGAAPAPATHMALRIRIAGEPWLADVGFGAAVPTSPLRLDDSSPQPTPHQSYRVLPFGGGRLVQMRLGKTWAPLYEVFPQAVLDEDYLPANWFTSTHDSSPFRHNLWVARVTPEERLALRNTRLTRRRPDGRTEQHELDAAAIRRALVETFGLELEPEWLDQIAQLAAAKQA
jgi:N-hydroxyarylamine O-acetyltransferase